MGLITGRMEGARLPGASTRAWTLVAGHSPFPGDDAGHRGARGISGTASRGDAGIPLRPNDRSIPHQSLS